MGTPEKAWSASINGAAIGGPTSDRFPGGYPPGIQIEDKTYNGWKIIRYDKYYFCWSDKDNLRGDMFLTPHNKYGAGYRGGTSDTKPCP